MVARLPPVHTTCDHQDGHHCTKQSVHELVNHEVDVLCDRSQGWHGGCRRSYPRKPNILRRRPPRAVP